RYSSYSYTSMRSSSTSRSPAPPSHPTAAVVSTPRPCKAKRSSFNDKIFALKNCHI
ncbi:Hypothetical protein FKW44_016998, partial [Caligus rogercresseyi]